MNFNPYIEPQYIQFFWDKVSRPTQRDEDGFMPDKCWTWIGRIKPSGYGGFSVNGMHVGAHVFSYVIHKGLIPEGLMIRHSCDNPVCVNPAHLSTGTHMQNMEDRKLSKRSIKGKPRPYIPLETKIEIRRLFKEGLFTQDELARKFGVAIRTVGRFCAENKSSQCATPQGDK